MPVIARSLGVGMSRAHDPFSMSASPVDASVARHARSFAPLPLRTADSLLVPDEPAVSCLHVTATGELLWANERARGLLRPAAGTATAEVNLTDLVHGNGRHRVEGVLADALEHGSSEFVARLPAAAESGEARFEHLVLSRRAVADADSDGERPRAVVVVQGWDVTGLVRQLHQLQDHSHRDPLTGHPNRATFLDRLHVEVARSRRTGREVAIMVVEVDDFHTVTDICGHAEGDRVLVEIGRRLTASLRLGDTVARTGATEFAVICPDLAGIQPAIDIAERLCVAVAEPMTVGAHRHSITITVGIESATDDDRDEDLVAAMLGQANQALLDHKRLRRALRRDGPG
jgi:diguanylate cyclase (GGDEF)-like protein